MTDAEIDRLEGIFKNPPSASGLAEHGLTLIAELRRIRVYVPAPVIVPAFIPAPEVVEPPASAPTPPIRPSKKGK